MNHQSSPHSLTDDIRHLGTALFTNSSRSLIKLPTDVVRDAITDHAGNLWFKVSTRLLDLDGLDKTFPAQLRFYNKKCSYAITMDGTAAIIMDTNAIPPELRTPLHNPHSGTLLIRYHILHAERHCWRVTPHPIRKPFQHLLTEIFPIVRPQPRPLAFLSGPILPA